MEILGIWIAAFLTLCIYSFLYKDNPFYRFAEYLFVGMSVGYGIVLSYHQGFIPFAWEPFTAVFTEGSLIGLIKLIPIAVGLLFFSGLSSRHTWLIRFPSAILIGVGCGLAIPNVLRANIFEQTRGTVEPFAVIHSNIVGLIEPIPPWEFFSLVFGAVLMVIGVICTLTYFFFSVEHRGPVKWVSKVGIAFLMVGFGSAFGNTVMGRVALLIQRVDFLLNDWLSSIGALF